MATTYLHRTTTSTGSDTTATLSAWVKRARTGVRHVIFAGWESSTERMVCGFESNDKLQMQIFTGGTAHDIETTRLFRDVSAWMHIVFQFNTSSGTEADRFKIFVNGVQETLFSTDDTISQNIEMKMWGSTSQETIVGARKNSSYEHYFDGEMSHVHIIDGTVYAPTVFGETDATDGMWKIKTNPSVTYGTNGTFLLKDGAVTTDSSANSNNYSTGGTLTATKDCPDNNLCTGNFLDNFHQQSNFSNGSNTVELTQPGGNHGYCSSTMGVSAGLWYFEAKPTSGDSRAVGFIDILQPDSSENMGQGGTGSTFCFRHTGQTKQGGSSSSYGSAYATNDIIGCYLDLTANKAYFAINGTIQNSGTGLAITAAASTTQGFYIPGADSTNGSDTTWQFNFGNGVFGSTPLTGTTYNDAGSIGIFKYSPNDGGSSSFDSAAKNFRTICTKNIKDYG